jgi:hypothetical protein
VLIRREDGSQVVRPFRGLRDAARCPREAVQDTVQAALRWQPGGFRREFRPEGCAYRPELRRLR